MPRITLQSLRCLETEDWSGPDECRIEVVVDGTLQAPLRRSLNDDQTWDLNVTYDFNGAVEVKLWDEDDPDPDDLLGQLTIGPGPTADSTGAFTGDGARYELHYRVDDMGNIPADPVQAAFAAFESSPDPGVWPQIPKAALIADMRATVANSFEATHASGVNQGNTPLCGPAAIVFELVSRHPERYVAICRSLFETGAFQGRTKEMRPSETLRQSKVHSGISVADWLLMAAMRDVENEIFPVEAGSNDFVLGITTPWEMKGWCFEILGFDRVAFESTTFFGEFDAMRTAQRARGAGGVAFLMIHSAMLTGDTPVIAHPDHWVSYLGGLEIDNGNPLIWDSGYIRFDCYSWGRSYHVDLGEGPFEDYMWGVVTGEP